MDMSLEEMGARLSELNDSLQDMQFQRGVYATEKYYQKLLLEIAHSHIEIQYKLLLEAAEMAKQRADAAHEKIMSR